MGSGKQSELLIFCFCFQHCFKVVMRLDLLLMRFVLFLGIHFILDDEWLLFSMMIDSLCLVINHLSVWSVCQCLTEQLPWNFCASQHLNHLLLYFILLWHPLQLFSDLRTFRWGYNYLEMNLKTVIDLSTSWRVVRIFLCRIARSSFVKCDVTEKRLWQYSAVEWIAS